MKAFQVTDFDSNPTIEDIPKPTPTPNQIRIKIMACGLNFADLLMQNGSYQDTPELPFVLGMEVSGIVDEVGSKVKNFSIGERVAVFGGHGGLAEYGCFDALKCFQIPDDMDFNDAAAFQIAYGTSHLALEYKAKVKPGETILVLGASGGVGLTAVQLGKLMGAQVIGIARGTKKMEIVEKMGADHVFDSNDPNLVNKLKGLGGVDVVYDPVGGDIFDESTRCINFDGRLLIIGFTSGRIASVPTNIPLIKGFSVMGVRAGEYGRQFPEKGAENLLTIWDWVREGKTRPHVHAELPLSQSVEGFRMLQQREVIGKLVICPDR